MTTSLSEYVNLPKTKLATINGTLNGKWLTNGLYSNMGYSNKCLSALNFLVPTINPIDYKHCCSLNRSITEVSRENELRQEVQNSKPE